MSMVKSVELGTDTPEVNPPESVVKTRGDPGAPLIVTVAPDKGGDAEEEARPKAALLT